MKILFGFLIVGVSLWIGCSSDPSADYQPLNLLSYGYPITIMAPDSPEVKTFDLIVKKDLTIKKGEDYFVQIFIGDAVQYNPAKVKESLLTDMKVSNQYFSRTTFEEDHGFIYELMIDSTHASYGFNYVQILGDKEYVFQTGLLGTFTEEQVRRMYDAVKPDDR